MTHLAIKAEGLGKLYQLGEQGIQYGRLSESISAAVSAPFRRIRGGERTTTRDRGELWALRDVDLEVPDGQVLGVVGRNGAGKTTLLKHLKLITDPTTGQAELHGRVGS